MAGFFVQRLSIASPAGWYPDGARSETGETVSSDSILALSAVWACVNLLCGTIASLPVMVYRTDANGDRIVAKDHPLYRLLHDSPNYDQTAVDFWEFVISSLELWGNAYARIERTATRTGTRIVSLVPVSPRIVSVRRTEAGALEYKWTKDGRSYVETDATMLHIRGFGGDPLGGLSTLHFGRESFGLAQAINRSAAATFRNGLRPFFQLVFDKWLTPEQRDLAEKKLLERYAGAVNSGRPYISEGGAKLEALSIKPEDAQMLQSRAFSVEEVCRFFGVPPFLIGHNEKSSGYPTSLEQQVLTFQKFTLRRRLKRIEQALEKQLLTPADRANGITIEINLDGLLRGDSAARSRFYQVMTGIGAMTINEVRKLENMPPVDGGDVPRMQMQNRPITEIDAEAIRQLIAEQQQGQSA
nr:phage portal protein [Rhizobium sp. CSW-27]